MTIMEQLDKVSEALVDTTQIRFGKQERARRSNWFDEQSEEVMQRARDRWLSSGNESDEEDISGAWREAKRNMRRKKREQREGGEKHR